MATGRHRRDTRPSSHSTGRPRVRVVLLLLALAALTTPVTLPSTAAMTGASPAPSTTGSSDPAPSVAARAPGTPARSIRIHLRVRGCDDCAVTPVQTTSHGDVTYRGRSLQPVDGLVRFTLPRHRFHSLGLVVDPSFRTASDLGPDHPVMVVTRARGTAVGAEHRWSDLSGRGVVSGCLPGPSDLDGTLFENTVVVRRVRLDGQPRAAAYLREAVRSAPYWTSVRSASKPLADAVICA